MMTRWKNLAYKYKGSLIRGFRAAVAGAIGILLTAATSGVLFPATMSPLMIITYTSLLQMLDKYLREKDNPSAQ